MGYMVEKQQWKFNLPVNQKIFTIKLKPVILFAICA